MQAVLINNMQVNGCFDNDIDATSTTNRGRSLNEKCRLSRAERWPEGLETEVFVYDKRQAETPSGSK